jgi:hypothetical protein
MTWPWPDGPTLSKNVLRPELNTGEGVAMETKHTQTLPRFCFVDAASKESDQIMIEYTPTVVDCWLGIDSIRCISVATVEP